MTEDEEIRFLTLGAQREGNRVLTAALQPLGLTPAQAEVISCLDLAGEASLKALGGLLVCENGSPSRLVDGLVGRKIVARRENPKDRRQATLRLTAEGKRLLAGICAVEAEFYRGIRRNLAPDDAARLIGQLSEFLADTPSGQAIARRKALAAAKARS